MCLLAFNGSLNTHTTYQKSYQCERVENFDFIYDFFNLLMELISIAICNLQLTHAVIISVNIIYR